MIQGVARVDNSFVQTLIEFNMGTQAQLNFVSDLEFYDEVMMCLQMVSYKPQGSLCDKFWLLIIWRCESYTTGTLIP